MCNESNNLVHKEIFVCESCGRDFLLDPEEIINPMQEIFCPNCLTPYLLEDD